MSGQDALFVAVRAMGFGEIGAKTLLKIVLDRGKDAFGEKSRGEERRGEGPAPEFLTIKPMSHLGKQRRRREGGTAWQKRRFVV